MTRRIATIALTLTLGLAAAPFAVAGWGHGPGPGAGHVMSPGVNCPTAQAVDDETRQQFFDDTEDLRQQLFEKRSAYFQLMSQANPDKDEAEALWSEIFDLQQEIQAKAAEYGMTPGLGRGGCGGGPAGCPQGGGGCGRPVNPGP